MSSRTAISIATVVLTYAVSDLDYLTIEITMKLDSFNSDGTLIISVTHLRMIVLTTEIRLTKRPKFVSKLIHRNPTSQKSARHERLHLLMSFHLS